MLRFLAWYRNAASNQFSQNETKENINGLQNPTKLLNPFSGPLTRFYVDVHHRYYAQRNSEEASFFRGIDLCASLLDSFRAFS